MFLVRAPDHLGDGVMAIPAIRALMELGPCQVEGPAWAQRMYGCSPAVVGPLHTAVLFKPSFSAAWAVRRLPRRVGVRWDMRAFLLTDPVPVRLGEHRIDEYRRIASVVGAHSRALPALPITADDRSRAPALAMDSVLLLPLTRSPKTCGWTGFRTLADALGGRAVFAAGPGECAQLKRIAGPHPVLPPLDIGTFAAVAAQVQAVVGNDSGLAHLAAAARRGAGVDPSAVHVIHGSTSPESTGPVGSRPHQGAPLPCQPCYAKRCRVADPAPCLSVSMAPVMSALEQR